MEISSILIKDTTKEERIRIVQEGLQSCEVQVGVHSNVNKKYPEPIKQYTGDILLVGINYDKKTKEHQCLIERYEKK